MNILPHQKRKRPVGWPSFPRRSRGPWRVPASCTLSRGCAVSCPHLPGRWGARPLCSQTCFPRPDRQPATEPPSTGAVPLPSGSGTGNPAPQKGCAEGLSAEAGALHEADSSSLDGGAGLLGRLAEALLPATWGGKNRGSRERPQAPRPTPQPGPAGWSAEGPAWGGARGTTTGNQGDLAAIPLPHGANLEPPGRLGLLAPRGLARTTETALSAGWPSCCGHSPISARWGQLAGSQTPLLEAGTPAA